MTDVAAKPNPLPQLATPGERLGWIFNDRNLYLRRYPEPPPEARAVPQRLHRRLARSKKGLLKRILVTFGVGVGVAILFGCIGSSNNRSSDDSRTAYLVYASLVGAAVVAAWVGIAPFRARQAIERKQRRLQAKYEIAYAAWDALRRVHDEEQQRAVDEMDEWGAAAPPPGTRRVDIVGGTTYGWEAVLTVFGGSLLATRGSMMLVDFTGEALCGELMQLAAATDRTVQELRLPSRLAEFDLVRGLAPEELVDCLVEAMYGDAEASSRVERHQDAMVLREISDVLAPEITMARLLAALRVLADRPAPAAVTAEESARLLDLHPDETRRQMHPQLRRIEACLHPLETMGRESAELGTADLTCLIADGGGGHAQNELLKDLMVQWLARRVRRAADPMGSLVLLGADEVHHRSIERLSTLCERRGVRLVLFFSHLRAESLQIIGGGEVALMRLGNHAEASQAAEFIGRGHKFVLTQLTRTLGGNETHTLAQTYGESEARGESIGKSFTRKGGPGQSRNETQSETRNWNETESRATGTNWSDASSIQRVYEYALEPRVLQDLPDYAMVLVKSDGRGSVIQAVEVDPAIVTLPRVSMSPIDPQPLPGWAEAVHPAARQPSQVTVSRPEPLAAAQSGPQVAAAPPLRGWGGEPSPQGDRR